MTTAPQVLTTRTLAARRSRCAAFLIDTLILLIATAPINVAFTVESEVSDESTLISFLNPYAGDPGWPIQVVITVLFAVYFWLQHALWGQTLGKRLCRMKVVSGATGEIPSLRQAGLRTLVHHLLTAIPYLGAVLGLVDMLWIFGDPQRRCLHDVIAKTIVIDLHDPTRKWSEGSGFLFRLGILISLFAAFALFSTLLAR
ncbi:RDD family protein [Nonomuraea sp. NPDC049152]|uniref:RDD family protein n=1 Tax=Nonomuraea sp. NPDC049152 TaxID=3154350 RepID=UPI0033E428A1